MRTALTELFGIEHPIVQAPMAAGPTTVELVVAVSEAGGLGSIAGATLSPDRLREQIGAVRARTSRPFAVNLFAPLAPPSVDETIVAAVQEFLAPHLARLGVDASEPRAPRWSAEDQLAAVVEERVPAFSFTFGVPPLGDFEDTILLGSANTVEEAAALERAGVHVVVAQGAEAGGHRATFIGSFDDGLVPLAELLPAVVERVSVPVVAAGGLMDGADVARVLRAGAAGAQLGTAFLYADEAGVGDDWKQALREHDTFVSAAYTGRLARGARTPFLAELDAGVTPAPYGVQRALLSPFQGHDGYGWYLGGTGAARARELPAAELVRALAAELDDSLRA